VCADLEGGLMSDQERQHEVVELRRPQDRPWQPGVLDQPLGRELRAK
jgi:hypothetical protein